jgi:hypothetical protein
MLGRLRIRRPVQNIGRNDDDIPLVNDHRSVLNKKFPFAGHQIENFVGAVKMTGRHMVA